MSGKILQRKSRTLAELIAELHVYELRYSSRNPGWALRRGDITEADEDFHAWSHMYAAWKATERPPT